MAQRHEFTNEETMRGAKFRTMERKRQERMVKRQQKHETHIAELELARTVLSNPAAIGSFMYLGVLGLEKVSERKLSSKAQHNFSILQQMTKNIPLFGPFVNEGLTAGVTGTTDLELLKLALLAYITTGGNVAGSLATIGGALKSVIP